MHILQQWPARSVNPGMTNNTIIRKLFRITGIATAGIAVLIVIAASWYLIQFYPRQAEAFTVNSPDQPRHILIATQGSDFKDTLVESLCGQLENTPTHINVIDVGDLDDVRAADWQRLLLINTAMMDRLNGSVRNFITENPDLDNALLMITSGGADFKPADLPVDAISGASRKSDLGKLTDMLADWALADNPKAWLPADPILGMEYFIRIDVAASCAAIARDVDRHRQAYPDLEGRLNRIGYDLVRRDRPEEALQAFRLNRDIFPESWNVYDSYAETLLATGNRDEAIVNYRKAVALNPDHLNGIRILAELGAGG
jgi:tetratricopeptide (TPR) repeat protein